MKHGLIFTLRDLHGIERPERWLTPADVVIVAMDIAMTRMFEPLLTPADSFWLAVQICQRQLERSYLKPGRVQLARLIACMNAGIHAVAGVDPQFACESGAFPWIFVPYDLRQARLDARALAWDAEVHAIVDRHRHGEAASFTPRESILFKFQEVIGGERIVSPQALLDAMRAAAKLTVARRRGQRRDVDDHPAALAGDYYLAADHAGGPLGMAVVTNDRHIGLGARQVRDHLAPKKEWRASSLDSSRSRDEDETLASQMPDGKGDEPTLEFAQAEHEGAMADAVSRFAQARLDQVKPGTARHAILMHMSELVWDRITLTVLALKCGKPISSLSEAYSEERAALSVWPAMQRLVA